MVNLYYSTIHHTRVQIYRFLLLPYIFIRIRMNLELCTFQAHVFDLYAVSCVILMGTYVDFCILIIGKFALYYYGMCYLLSQWPLSYLMCPHAF